jgi:hypothetical protein
MGSETDSNGPRMGLARTLNERYGLWEKFTDNFL